MLFTGTAQAFCKLSLVVVLAITAASTAYASPDSDTSSDALSRFLERNARFGGQDTAGEQGGFVQQFRTKASDMVVSSMRFLGVPYVRGGTSADKGFDCSGFTRYIFEHSLGLVLPRRADEQAQAEGLVKVKRDELKPGDLVFFNTLRRTFSHVGIYIGEGKFIHSPRTGSEVRVEDMRESYWTKRFTGARRVPQIDADVAKPMTAKSSGGGAMAGAPSFSTSAFGAGSSQNQDPLGLLSSPSNATPSAR